MKRNVVFVLFFVILLTSATPAFANHREDVLGTSTETNPQIPPTSEGPGLILPDSPFFFLDQLKQDIRLAFALTPEAKAKVHTSIAGERMAELRFMLAKNNKTGIDTALNGVSANLLRASEDLNQAELTGRNIDKLALEINTNIKEKQNSLDILEQSDNKEIMFKAKAANQQILDAKVQVEEVLPEGQLSREVEYDLINQIDDNIYDASSSAKGLEHSINVLTRLASQAAEKDQQRREEALRHAIENKNETLKRKIEAQITSDQRFEEQLLKLRQNASAEVNNSITATQKAAFQLEMARKMQSQKGSRSAFTASNSASNSSGGSN